MNQNQESLLVKITYREEKEASMQKRLFGMIPSILCLAGIVLLAGQMISYRQEGIHTFAVILAGVIGCLIGSFLPLAKRKGQIAVLGVCGVFLIAGILFRGILGGSMASVLNQIMEYLTGKQGYYHLPFKSETSGLLFLLIVSVGLGILVGVIAEKVPFILQLMMAGIVFGLLIVGLLQGEIGFIIFMAGMLLVSGKTVTGQWRAKVTVVAEVMVVCLLFGGIAIAGKDLITRLDITEKIEKKIHELRYESHENALSEGKLTDVKAPGQSEDAALTVTMDKWAPLYIKGYVGETYEKNRWSSLGEEDIRKYGTTLYDIQSGYFFPSQQMGQVSAIVEEASGEENITSKYKVEITNTGACSAYTYLPYGGTAQSALDPKQLTKEGGNGGKSMSYATYVYDVSESYELASKLAELSEAGGFEQVNRYTDGENEYREMVYDLYTRIPEETASVLAKYFDLNKTADLTTSQLRTLLTDWVDEALEYDDTIGRGEIEGDFITHLLEKNPSGGSREYATLTTLLFRACGVPARYVEGYLLPESVAKSLTGGVNYNLTEANAYAWAEMYLEGVGWIPVDTTPDHADEIDYRLPIGESSQSVTGARGSTSTNQESSEASKRKQQILQAEDAGEEDTDTPVLDLQWLLLILFVLFVMGNVVRIIYLRKKLKDRIKGFTQKEPRYGAADCYAYTVELLETIPSKKDEEKRDHLIERILKEEGLELRDELWFSNHDFKEEQRKQFLKYYGASKNIWKKRVKKSRQFFLKWISCKVY